MDKNLSQTNRQIAQQIKRRNRMTAKLKKNIVYGQHKIKNSFYEKTENSLRNMAEA